MKEMQAGQLDHGGVYYRWASEIPLILTLYSDPGYLAGFVGQLRGNGATDDSRHLGSNFNLLQSDSHQD